MADDQADTLLQNGPSFSSLSWEFTGEILQEIRVCFRVGDEPTRDHYYCWFYFQTKSFLFVMRIYGNLSEPRSCTTYFLALERLPRILSLFPAIEHCFDEQVARVYFAVRKVVTLLRWVVRCVSLLSWNLYCQTACMQCGRIRS